jgi:L-ascorbate metabolism protein UlaG (beta-lactamase superfamily)
VGKILKKDLHMNITITHIDTACILLDINGYKILTDPTLDQAGRVYHHGYGGISRKTGSPALLPDDLSNIDLILLSHHQHKDNLDIEGMRFAEQAPNIISTKAARRVLPQTIGLDNWEYVDIKSDKVTNLRITATPAQHHPSWLPEFISGKVIGFVIEFDEQEKGVIYISGDTVYFEGIDEVARRYNIDAAIMHLGAVQFRYLTGFGRYTMDGKDLIKAVKVLRPCTILPIHYRGWTHFKESEDALRKLLEEQDEINYKTIFLKPGVPLQLP